jgi:hypothetical protein
MQRCLLVAILVVFATPGFSAEKFYVGYNGKRCEVFNNKTPANWNMLGTYRSQHDAEKAMHNLKPCQKD